MRSSSVCGYSAGTSALHAGAIEEPLPLLWDHYYKYCWQSSQLQFAKTISTLREFEDREVLRYRYDLALLLCPGPLDGWFQDRLRLGRSAGSPVIGQCSLVFTNVFHKFKVR